MRGRKPDPNSRAGQERRGTQRSTDHGRCPQPNWNRVFHVELPEIPEGEEIPKWALDAVARSKSLAADARKEWRRLIPILEDDNPDALSPRYLTVLREHCVCTARIAECERILTRDGMVALTERGPVKHPCVTTVNQYRQQLRFYIQELGLGPVSRGRLPEAGPKEPDDDDLNRPADH